MAYRSIVSGKVYIYPRVVISMTDHDVIKRVADLFGNKVYHVPVPDKRRTCLPQYRAVCQGAKAVMLMRRILPYMGLRRSEKIQDLIKAWENRPPQSQGNAARSLSMLAYRQRLRGVS